MMTRPEAIGQSFNLIGDAMFSGRDYFEAIRAHRRPPAGQRLEPDGALGGGCGETGAQAPRPAQEGRAGGLACRLEIARAPVILRQYQAEATSGLGDPEADRDAFWRRRAIGEAHLFW